MRGDAARQLQDAAQDDAAATSFAGYVHVADMQQLAADAASTVCDALRGVEVDMLSLVLARQHQQQPDAQQPLEQQQQQQTAAAMTQRQGQQYWERWQQQQQQQHAGNVWFPSNLGLPQDRYHALLEQVAIVAEVGAAFLSAGLAEVGCLPTVFCIMHGIFD
jgi:hypothetical protein